MLRRSLWFRPARLLVMAAIAAGLAPVAAHAWRTAPIEYHELTEPLDSEAAASLDVKLAPTDRIRRSTFAVMKTRYWMYQIASQSQNCDLEPCRVLIRDIKEGRTILDLKAKGKINSMDYPMGNRELVASLRIETLCG